MTDTLSADLTVRPDPLVAPAAGAFERIPKWLNLFPMVAQWLWLGLRHGSMTLPSSVNPQITTGGMVGDGKLEYFRSMGVLARAATADFIAVATDCDPGRYRAQMQAAGLGFPIVAKPDLGWCGYGVRLLESWLEFEAYFRAYPANEKFLLQRFIPDEGEAGVFYVREPGHAKGRLIGLLLREFPKVTGDGIRPVRELIAADIRLRRLIDNELHECRFDPDYIPLKNQTVRLALIGSTRVGGAYFDGTQFITPQLSQRVDEIAKDMGTFHVGRFDVRFETLASLGAGDFTIMEVNGAGSEAVHAWDPKYSIRDVYRIVFAKQRLLFAIGAACRKAGHRPCSAATLMRNFFRQQKLMRRYPRSN
jgi:hypothetical protein